MRISIFTPTHKPEYISDLYNSIKDQNFYEWVIITNNGAYVNIDDDRVKIFNFNHNYIGALKKFACSKCTGDILLEVDHDDLLTPDAIDEIKPAFRDSEVGFVYSNCAEFKDNFIPNDRYNSDFGWKYKYFNYDGHDLNECISFAPTPSSVGRIWYAPNHIRAWRKSVYDKIGGHNENMIVLDDQDLLCRTYIATKMKHINKCLYLYRVTGENSWLKYNKEIQDNVQPIFNKYLFEMSIKWSELNNFKMLDLGGRFNGDNRLECVDISNGVDLNKRFPFEDNSVGLIRANDILEHLEDKLHVIKEIYRVLAPNGILLSMTPNALSQGGFQDPTHKSFYVKNSFKYYTEERFAKFIDTPVRFQNLHLYTTPENCDGVSWIVANMLALKGQKVCGRVDI